MSKNNSIAIVILTWNDAFNTIECLNSLYQNNNIKFDIILVDNNSDEINYQKVINWLNKKKIKIHYINKSYKFHNTISRNNINFYLYKIREVANFRFAKNLGITRGYNKGINFALKKRYNFITRLDCDFIVPRNFVKGLLETLLDNQYAVAASPKVYYHVKKKTKLIWWVKLIFSKNYFTFHQTGKNQNRRVLDKGQFTGISNSDSVCGCCVMYRSKSLKQCLKIDPPRKNVFDEDFFFGPDDMELSYRLKKIGDILVNMDNFAYHKVSQSIHVSGIKSNIYFATIGWLLLTKKVCNKQDQILCRIFFILRGILHLFRLVYKKNKDPHIGFLLGLKDYFIKY